MAPDPHEKSIACSEHTPILSTKQSSPPQMSTRRMTKNPLDNLAKKHNSLCLVAQEVPSSRCGSPLQDDGENSYESVASKARVDALRQRVKHIFEYARGEPADGKWSLLAQLLQLTVTKGRLRWLGTSSEATPPESSAGWINATTEEEWIEWEKNWRNAKSLKEKVENWQRNVEIDPAAREEVPDKQNASAGGSTPPSQVEVRLTGAVPSSATVCQQKTSALNFPVVKRSTLGNPKPKGAAHSLPSVVDHRPKDPTQSGEIKDISSQKRKGIADVSETSFLPPSFQNGLQTSTPSLPNRRPPSPIPRVPSASPNIAVHPPILASSSVPQFQEPPERPSLPKNNPSTPTRNRTPPKTTSHRSPSQCLAKRALSPTDDDVPHTAKKSRSLSPSEAHALDGKGPVTPKRQPTLTELLASSRTKQSTKRSIGRLKTFNVPAHIAETSYLLSSPTKNKESNVVEKIPDSVAAAKTAVEPLPSLFCPSSQIVDGIEDLPPVKRSVFPPVSSLQAPPVSAKSSIGYAESLHLGTYESAPSPVKSLSSLAADSDSDDSDYGALAHEIGTSRKVGLDSDPIEEFDPPFASTQVDGIGGRARSEGRPKYNSQFDVDGRVDMVTKFMERDVAVDFDGWLKDSSEELVAKTWDEP